MIVFGRNDALMISHTEDEAKELFRQVVTAELDNWVPDASQRLIRRAALALDQDSELARGLILGRTPTTLSPDHGPDRLDHPLLPNWVAGIYVMQCATCARLFRA